MTNRREVITLWQAERIPIRSERDSRSPVRNAGADGASRISSGAGLQRIAT
jgi:hypothetical protein